MEDGQIIGLYLSRDERAIKETEKKYGAYCRSISLRILKNKEDCEECINDTWMSAWISIPPEEPQRLSAYLGRIARNLSLKRYASSRAKKRGSGEIPLVLDELSLCIPDRCDIEDTLDARLLQQSIDSFLSSLSVEHRRIFMQRYWYMCSIKEIAEDNSMTQSNVKMTLLRLRNTLREKLKREGVEI